MKVRLLALGILILGVLAGYFVYPKWGIWESLNVPFRLGLDLKGGINLTYRANLDSIPDGQRSEALEGLRDVIERRVNFFGVSEPVVRTERTLEEDRLNVQLAGIFDTEQAIKLIGETPFLEFRKENPAFATSTPSATSAPNQATSTPPVAGGEPFIPTELTGRYLRSASLQFDQTSGKAYIQIDFNDEGARIFEELTEQNVGKPLAIYLDGAPISIPLVQGKISGGTAQITGDFTPEEARLLAQRLNSGALPVPIELISQRSIEPSRGEEALKKSFGAGLIGFVFVLIFMVVWYRLPGLIAIFALGVYVSLTLAFFKIIPVTMTTAGIAGFILSIGMAVDANILIFERLKEELKRGRTLAAATEEGFDRAWTSVRDSNTSSLITAIILWYFGTDAVRGFALTLGLGIVISMFSAIVVSRTFLRAVQTRRAGKRFLYGSGLGGAI